MRYYNSFPKINGYSLTDFHDFDECTFRFAVRHILDKKYEIDTGNESMALGNLLDQAMKKFHKAKYYGCDPKDLEGLVRASAREMLEMVKTAKEAGKHHFYETSTPFLTEPVISEAVSVFTTYYKTLDNVIKPSLGDVGFCDWVFEIGDGTYKLWGGPDTLELGDDGVPEVVDYKSRKNLDRGKSEMDMDLMPKIYMLLMRQKLLDMGYKKARFVVRFWQDPMEGEFKEEFDLEDMRDIEKLVRAKVKKILEMKEISFCEGRFCSACKSEKREELIKELESLGLSV